MLEDEENLVKILAFDQLGKMVLDFKHEEILASTIKQTMTEVYNENTTDHLLREVLDVMITNSGKLIYKIGA
jgi:hypothetical protein